MIKYIAISGLILFTGYFSAVPAAASETTDYDTLQQMVVLEARVPLSAEGCPLAVELWLTRTPDTIAGIEAAVAFDRPDVARFIEAQKPEKVETPKAGAADSLAILRQLSENAAECDRSEGLLKDWQYTRASLTNAARAKLMSVADYAREGGPQPIAPGQRGLLLRLPIALIAPPEGAPVPDSVTVYLDRAHLRVADKMGNLLPLAVVQPVTVPLQGCPIFRQARPKHR